jgi:gluconolactonase
MKLNRFDVRYSPYIYIARLILMFCCITPSLFAADITEDLYISRDFTKEGIFTGGCEGPAVDSKGYLYAVNLTKDGTIAVVDSAGNARIFATLPSGSIGNGIRFDRFDNMYIADYSKHNIWVIPFGKTKAELCVHQALFNQPNDLAIMSNGILFASHTNWSNDTGKLWRIGSDKVAVLLDANMGTTNGLEVSPNDMFLYVNELAQLKIWKFDLNEKGEISNKTLFASFDDFGLDGMRCDVDGNLYVTRYGKGVVAIFSPEGRLLREVQLKGKEVSNIAFGGVDGRSCIMTMADRKMIETFRTETPGREWNLSLPTSVLEINSPEGRLEIFPNPTNSKLTLSNLKPDSNAWISDISGK